LLWKRTVYLAFAPRRAVGKVRVSGATLIQPVASKPAWLVDVG